MTKALKKVSGVQMVVALSAMLMLSACADSGPQGAAKPSKDAQDNEVVQGGGAKAIDLYTYAYRTSDAHVTVQTASGAKHEEVECKGTFKLSSHLLACQEPAHKSVQVTTADGRFYNLGPAGTTQFAVAGTHVGFLAGNGQLSVMNLGDNRSEVAFTQENVKTFGLNQNTVAYKEKVKGSKLVGKKLADQSVAFELDGSSKFQISDSYVSYKVSNSMIGALGKMISGSTLYLYDLATASFVEANALEGYFAKSTSRKYSTGHALQIGNGAYVFTKDLVGRNKSKLPAVATLEVMTNGAVLDLALSDEDKEAVKADSVKLQGNSLVFFNETEKTARIYDLTAKTLSAAIENVASIDAIQAN